jgi:hypothetical protein
MEKKTIIAYTLDATIVVMAVVSVALIQTSIPQSPFRLVAVGVCVLLPVLFLGMECYPLLRRRMFETKTGRTKFENVTAVVLLGDEGNEVKSWDLNGLTALIIGRDGEVAQADIDLSGTEYGGLIENQHASLNFVEDAWYIEDLSSRNGTAISRPGSDGFALLAPGVPCRLKSGDAIIIAGQTKLLVKSPGGMEYGKYIRPLHKRPYV